MKKEFLKWMNLMNLMRFLYDTREGERTKLKSLTLIATRFSDDEFEEYFNYLITCNLEDIDENDE